MNILFSNRIFSAIISLKRNVSFLLLVTSLIMAQAFDSSAQPRTSNPDLGINPNGANSTSGIDSVNLQNGNVTVKIPLASLPPIAGGKLSYTLTATYNSKVWSSYKTEGLPSASPQNPCPSAYTNENVGFADDAGWRIGGSYSIVFRNARDDYDYVVPQQSCDLAESQNMLGQFFKPVLVTPDGAEHEMRFMDSYQKYTGNREHLAGYYKTTGANFINTPRRMYSTDGSYLYAVYNPPNDPITWTIYMNDGTQVIQYSDGVQRIRDSNGNSIKFYGEGGFAKVQDEGTGREIKYRTTGTTDQRVTEIQYQTVGGVWQTVTANWGTTMVQGKLYGSEIYCDTSNIPDPPPSAGYIFKEFGGGAGQIPVLRQIIFPSTEPGITPQKYQFAYNSDTTVQTTDTNVKLDCNFVAGSYTRTASLGLGELSRIDTPSGAVINYNYTGTGTHKFGSVGGGGSDEMVKNVVTSKTVSHDGVTDTWQYGIDTGISNVNGSVVNPDGSSSLEVWYPTNPLITRQYGGAEGKGGLVYRTVQSNKIVNEKHWILTPFAGAEEYSIGSLGQKLNFNTLVDAEYTTLLSDSGQREKMSAKTYQYDFNGNLLQTTEYDWFDPASVTYDGFNIPTGVPAGATVLRVTNSSYHKQATGAGSTEVYAKRNIGSLPNVLNAVQETVVSNSKTRFSYDSQVYGTAPTKGNVTGVSVWDDVNNRWDNTVSAYNTYGNVTSTTDPRGNVTQLFYEDATHAAPTRTVVDPQNGTGQQISTATYDFSTGLPLTSTDINGNVSSVDYTNNLSGTVDPFGRPGKTYSPYVDVDGVQKRRTTMTFYEDGARKVRAEADLNNEGDRLLKSSQISDQLGRTILSEKTESDGSIVTAQNVYLQAGKITLSSNPKKANGAATNGWTRATKDLLGRTVEAASFKGDVQPPATGTNADWMGSVTTDYVSNTKTVTDQAGRKRKGVSDALGRTTQVIEDPNGQNLATNYQFDSLGNIRKTVQGGQSRYFLYDSLGRVIRARQPEIGTNAGLAMTDALTGNGQWSNAYSYDANGNTVSTTDARGITLTGTYDRLNRLTFRDYSDSTPDVTMVYEDSTVALSKGKLTKVVTGDPNNPLSVTKYTAFDALGGVKSSQQTVAGQSPYNFAYTYNLAGGLTSETYPSGRTVKQFYDGDGELSAVSGRGGQTGAFKSYVARIDYNAGGAVEKMQLGNGKWETSSFNARGQVTQIGLGDSATDKSILKLDFEYGTSAENNGGLRKQTITTPTAGGTAGFTAVQNYSYDALNRLQSSSETLSGEQNTRWKQTFAYDRFGNRTFDMVNTTIPTTSAQASKVVNPNIDAATNRLVEDQDGDSVKDYDYDVAGNLIKDAEGKLFAYDAEGRQKSFGTNGSNANGGQYVYDGQGKRIKKIVPVGGAGDTVETTFVYDAFGKLSAEYENTVATQQTAKTNFITEDYLGSPRIVTDQSGAVVSRHDYNAYGEELQAGMLGANDYRKAEQKYSASDNVRQQYTGYERDKESGLDYAQARYYNSKHGRFTSVDPLTASASIRNPQTFNRYSYALNSPYKFTDPLGLAADPTPICRGGTLQPGGGDCSEAPVTTAPTGQSGQPQQTQPPIPVPPAIDSSLLGSPDNAANEELLPTPTSVTVTQNNVPAATRGININGRRYAGVFVQLTFTVFDQYGNPLSNYPAVESVVNIEGETVIQNEFIVTLDSSGRGTDYVGNSQSPPPANQKEQNMLLKRLNSDFITTQEFRLNVPLRDGGSLQATQTRTLTNLSSKDVDPSLGVRGYTFSSKPVVTSISRGKIGL